MRAMLHMAGMASTIRIQFSTNIQVDLKIGTLQLAYFQIFYEIKFSGPNIHAATLVLTSPKPNAMRCFTRSDYEVFEFAVYKMR